METDRRQSNSNSNIVTVTVVLVLLIIQEVTDIGIHDSNSNII